MTELLYHYTSGKGLMGIIDSSQLHCSHISFLNDPSEHLYFEGILDKLLSANSVCKTIYSRLFNDSLFEITYGLHDYYVLSFSKNPDSLSMWNYYAKGNGYNIGIDVKSIIEKNNTDGISIVELIYDKVKQYRVLQEFIESFLDELNSLDRTCENGGYEYKEERLIQKFNSGLIKNRCAFKHSGYAREEEVRILIPLHKERIFNVYHRISETGVIVEFIKLDINLKDDVQYLTVHPLGNSLHVMGLKRYLWNKTKELDITKSTIPFRKM